MTFVPLFQAGQHVMVLMRPGSGNKRALRGPPTPVPLQGVISGEDPGGLLIRPDDRSQAGHAYVTYDRIETVLLLPDLSDQERRKNEFEDRVQEQKVFAELDRIFFEMADRRDQRRRRSPSED